MHRTLSGGWLCVSPKKAGFLHVQACYQPQKISSHAVAEGICSRRFLNVLANLVAGAIVYLLGVVAGLFLLYFYGHAQRLRQYKRVLVRKLKHAKDHEARQLMSWYVYRRGT
ncbi:hypothetical protein [Paractinoplanes durhamensis]|uniref:hypothetical protein n=1 Tax=Paractinoplanes durhamensis TaxID=113563 RepID=UPI003645A7D9